MSHYNSIQYASVLSDEKMRKLAPSIFSEVKHETRSKRFEVIPTQRILTRLASEGWFPVYAHQSMPRDTTRIGHAQHVVRLRHHKDLERAPRVDDEFNEVIIRNASDGTSAWIMEEGRFRQVCSNGMYCSISTSIVRIKHANDCLDRASSEANLMIEKLRNIDETIIAMKCIDLSPMQQVDFGNAALELRYGSLKEAPFEASAIIAPIRDADKKNDVYTVFNRIQESIIKGGIMGRSPNGRRTTSREVRSVAQNASLNRGLWGLALERLSVA